MSLNIFSDIVNIVFGFDEFVWKLERKRFGAFGNGGKRNLTTKP